MWNAGGRPDLGPARRSGRFRRCFWTAAALLVLAAGTARASLDDFYYTYDEIRAEFDSLEALYPGWLRVDSIGYAYESERPIWSAVISDNVQLDEDEPALWINGACHAEEILGINISMAFVRELLHWGSMGHPDWGPLISSIEFHVLPTNNPDGLGIVMSETDVTYRKNLHSFVEDGHCQITPGIGNDSCGVDLNRNYPAWWNHGDTLWIQNADPEQFDYFRGLYPLSESECACVAEQAERERFVAAVAYHSARTSTNHEIIIHPWEWEEGKTCPPLDYEMMQQLTRNMGDQIEGENYEFYRNLAGGGRKGNHHNWIYGAYGAVGLLIEVGTQGEAGMQPQDQEFIDFVVEENISGLVWLCRRIIGFEVDAPGLWVHLRDAQTQEPLAARLRIEEVYHPDLAPYYATDPQYGAYYRLLQPAPYTIALRKHGYAPLDTTVNVGNTLPTLRTWELEPLERHACTIEFQSQAGAEISPRLVEIYDLGADTTLSFRDLSTIELELPGGVYHLTALLTGYVDLHHVLQVDQAESWILLALEEGGLREQVFVEELNSLDDFVQTGEGCAWTEAYNDSMGWHFEDAPGLFSAPGVNCRLASAGSWHLESAGLRDLNPGSLSFTEYHQLEGGSDSACVEISVDGGQNWETVLGMTGPGKRLRERSVDLAPWSGAEAFRFAFRVVTDVGVEEGIEDSGLHLRDVRLAWNGSQLDVADRVKGPHDFGLFVSPNPFNPCSVIHLQVPPSAAGANAAFRLYDLLGREVRRLEGFKSLRAGVNRRILGAEELPSGLYFLRIEVEQGGRKLWDHAQKLTVIR